MAQQVLIPNRGIIALDIIHSLKSLGHEAILMHSPEDSLTLPVKLADRSYKFFSSRLEDSYLDQEAIIEKAAELKVDCIHPGYGFLAENAAFAGRCRDAGVRFVGPEEKTLEIVADKLALRRLAAGLGIRVMPSSNLIRTPLDFSARADAAYPMLIKPLRGLGGAGIRYVSSREEAQERLALILAEESWRRDGVFCEEFWPESHHIEIPFFRDRDGRILLLPEIESSLQRRFQKLLQESPSIHVDRAMRETLYHDSQKLIDRLDYVGLGYIEFFVHGGKSWFSEINPTFQINTLMAEIHLTQNIIKKQFAISGGEPLHNVDRLRVVEPKHHVLLISLMAEDPANGFRPSAGVIDDFFHYATIRNVFKTTLYTGARVSELYDPFIGKILTYAFERANTFSDMRSFLDNIIIRGIRTNLIFMKHLLESERLLAGETGVDFLRRHVDFSKRQRSAAQEVLAAAMLAADFHLDNRRKNFKGKLEKMKQPGLLRRLLRGGW